jgi:hypothetical protein
MLDDLLTALLTGMRPVWAGVIFAIAALLLLTVFDGLSWTSAGIATLLGAGLGVLLFIAEFTIHALRRIGGGR